MRSKSFNEESATGQRGDPAGFAAHGHLVRLLVERG
jgi:hypothetical protein